MTVDDQATAAEELDRSVCLANKRPELARTGICYNCHEPTEGEFCSPECREDYDKRKRFNHGQ